MSNIIRVDTSDPIWKKAFELSLELKSHCEEHNISKSSIINGVAIDAETIAKDAIETFKNKVQSL